MKHNLRKSILLALFMILSSISIHAQTEVVAGWTFGTVTGAESPFADQGNFLNVGIQEITLTNANITGYVAGSPGRAITSSGWINEGERFWVVPVNSTGFSNLTLSSKQQSSGTGPRDFKAQYSLDGLVWTDIPGASITVANNLTTGVLNKIALPSEASNKPLLLIRWLNTSDISVNDAAIGSGGTNRIDEIFIEGEPIGEILDPTATPIIDPNGGTFDEAVTVTLSSSSDNASIYYTLDSSEPNLGSLTYTGPIVIEESATLSAIALADGLGISAVATADFIINVPATPATGIPYVQNFENFVSLSSPVTTFGSEGEWTFSAGALNYNGLFGSGTAGGFRGGDVLGYQHTGTSGLLTATLTLENTTGFPISDLEISYLGRVSRVDQTRFPEWTVTVNGTTVSELSYSTSSGEDENKSALLSGLNILPGELVTIEWSSDRGFNAGGGSRQIGIANLNITIPEVLEPIEFVNWDFTGAPGDQVSTTGNALVQGVVARDFTRGAGINATGGNNSINSNGWNAGDDRYFTFGFNVSADKLVDMTALQIGSTSSNTGPRDLALVYSGDGFTTRLAEWQHTGSFVNQIIDLSTLQNLSGDVEFRIIATSDVSANGGTISSGGTSRVTNFFPGAIPVTFTGIVKDADGVIIPRIEVSPSELNFGAVSLAGTTSVISYEISAENLEGDVTVSAPAPYQVSKDGNIFSESIVFTEEELSVAQTVFVQLNNSNVGTFNASITNTTSGTLPVSVSVSGSVFDPFNIFEDFNNICQANLGPIGGSWSTVSVLGDQDWLCTNFGRAGTTPTASAPFGMQINGFAAGSARLNEDWLITPEFDLTGFNIPLLSFYSRVAFTGPRLKLMISTDYVEGDPNLANWTELEDRFANGDVWTFSGELDLTEYLDQKIRLAFVYNSSPEEGAARWTLDDFELRSSDVPAAPFFSNNIGNVDYFHFGIIPAGTVSSETRSFNFNLSNPIAPLTINNGPVGGFEFSKNGVDFSPSLNYSVEELTGTKTVTVRFAPTSEGAFSGPITFESGDINVKRGYLTGATVSKDKTFDVVNWNIEWFGSPSNGPSNLDLQLQNVKTIIEDLDADVYAFQEITGIEKLDELIEALEDYEGIVSPAVSLGPDNFETAQKLVFLYKKSTVEPINTRVLLEGVQPSDLVGYPSPPDRFWASGRLPFLLEVNANIDGKKQKFNLINVHARSNGGGESAGNPRYAMRRYDVDVLKDSLDMYYPNVPLIILGDYNDDLDETVADQTAPTVNTSETSFISYINDPENYIPVTLSLSNAGLRSFPSFENVIDHVIISDELRDNWIVNSERLVAPFDLVQNYLNTTSDHIPVKTRFTLRCDIDIPMIIGENELCLGSGSTELQLLGGNFTQVVFWESSLDGQTWEMVEGSEGLSVLEVSGLTATTQFRALAESDICFNLTDVFTVTNRELPEPFILFERGMLTTIEGPYTFTWFKDENIIQTGSSNAVRTAGSGNYRVVIQDESGCERSSETIRFPIRPTNVNVRVFPNPADRQVTISLRNAEGLHNVELRTSAGALIASDLTSNGFAEFDVSNLSKGTYLIVITNQLGQRQVERLIIR
ncbi:chitobiase/beta-hexosaminidase C-terminal domain-containing protein [Arthrospiribacter ruber]|uniref:T9SS C-terminal target domain-containing protein n=1 Tax=Arthrospiribacter ruber TaxID=2487934 RepID=A0A951IWL2_9BACT|nr:chitobiase/beta-hexosaminidase C-terminal domain-containing protein [Arthrospiribacter ruber]MBW3468570.1 T9SS C-terminal target domain-containing protein [Arthrospiribacter ruber]